MKRFASAALLWCQHSIVMRAIEFTLFFGLLFLSVRTNYQHPEWNFDLVGYAAVVTSYSTDDPAEIQRRTYKAMREGLPRNDYTKLAGSSPYRKALAKRPETLMTQLRLYRNKPMYLAAVSLMHKLGANLARATFYVSLLAYVLLALLIRWWLARKVPGPWASAFCVCLMLSHPIFLAARMAAPDMLAALVIVPAMLCLLERKWAWGLVLVLSITVRPDAVLLVGLVCGGLFVWPPEGLRRRTIAGFGVGALATYVAIHQLTAPYPYRVFLKHSLTTRLYEPSRMSEAITWSEYVEGLRKSIFVHGYTLYPSPLWLFGMLAGVAFFVARRLRDTTTAILVASCCGYVALHILLFPVRNDRYFTGHYLVVALAALFVMAKLLSSNKPLVEETPRAIPLR
jgi:hypothetical protein